MTDTKCEVRQCDEEDSCIVIARWMVPDPTDADIEDIHIPLARARQVGLDILNLSREMERHHA